METFAIVLLIITGVAFPLALTIFMVVDMIFGITRGTGWTPGDSP